MSDYSLSCPIPLADLDTIQMAHGGGGRRMQRLLEQTILPSFHNPILAQRHDSAALKLYNTNGRLAFTSDSYVVRPLFFPGGDIGSLAVNGTINDLAMSGARPLWISAAFILEEGLPMSFLKKIVDSMQQAAEVAGVTIVTGDTKVVDRGKGDGIYITTAGIGAIEHSLIIAPASVLPGDAIILSGDVGRHGIAVMAQREGLEFETPIASDCAPLNYPVQAMLSAGLDIHCLRDLTRGGLAGALVEIAEVSGLGFRIEERFVHVEEPVQGACELLGLDPLYIANEGRFIAFVPQLQAEQTLKLLRRHPLTSDASRIGTVLEEPAGIVSMKNLLGTVRILDMLSGDQLPRIC